MTQQATSRTRTEDSQVCVDDTTCTEKVLKLIYADGGDGDVRIELNDCVARDDIDSLIAGLDQGEDTEETNFMGLTPL